MEEMFHMPAKLFRMWEMYAEVEPFGELRSDYRAASIVQMLYNVNRGKDVQPIKLEECLLKFGETPAEKPAKTPMQMFNILKLLAAAHASDEAVPRVIQDEPASNVISFPIPEPVVDSEGLSPLALPSGDNS